MSDGPPSYGERTRLFVAKTLARFVDVISGPRIQLWLLAVAGPIVTVIMIWLINDAKDITKWPTDLRAMQLQIVGNLAYIMAAIIVFLIMAFASQLIAGVKLSGPMGTGIAVDTRGAEDKPPPPHVPFTVETVTTTTAGPDVPFDGGSGEGSGSGSV